MAMVRGSSNGGIDDDSVTAAAGVSDEDLLARFLERAGVPSQDAFEELVARHGPRVLRICRHVLDREHDAEDAFQATFLALARSGGSIRERCALAGWLQEVAYRTALKTRARRSRRRLVEREVMVLQPPRDQPDDQGDRAELAELRPVLHEEVTGLPDKYRLPVVLSYLEGRTNEEVATLLKWPIGTVKGRLSRGRALLRSRLSRRGVALSTAALLWRLSESSATAADVPAALLEGTLRRAAEQTCPPASGPTPRAADPRVAPESTSAEPTSRAMGEPKPPSPRPRKKPSGTVAGRLVAVSAVLLAFLVSIYVGGLVSSTAYGGHFPDVRGALTRFTLSAWWSAGLPCSPSAGTTSAAVPPSGQSPGRTSVRDRGRADWKGR